MLEDKYPDITPCYNLVKVANLLAKVYGLDLAVEVDDRGSKSLVYRNRDGLVWAQQVFDPRFDEEQGLYNAIDQIIRRHPSEIFLHIRENIIFDSKYGSEMNQNIASLKLGLASYIMLLATNNTLTDTQAFLLKEGEPIYSECFNLRNGGFPHLANLPYANLEAATHFMAKVSLIDSDQYPAITTARDLIASAAKYIHQNNNTLGIAINVFAANCVKSLETGPILS